MWRVCKQAGRPWPVLCPEDDVIDYMVMEAVAIKVRRLDEKAEKEQRTRQEQEEARKRLAKQFG